MYCSHCGKEIIESSNFCSFCGACRNDRIAYKRLTLSSTDSKIAGVCGGIAEYLGIDPTVARLCWMALSVVPGGVIGGVIAYVLAWSIIPKSRVPAPTVSSAPRVQGTPVST
jgi:phage shock protein PspC (stress-responsive transcriptional regulator)